MNLVKAQALANDLPIPELQKYANGFNPRIIPPWIATGTLQAKTDAKKRIDNMMGGTQGETPSVKEQIEQKAGLMAAQAMQQQHAQQQMAQRPQPGPAPENIPQPEAQPQESMMARGGLAKVPMQFSFKPGGIVGYASQGYVDLMGSPGLQEQELVGQAAELAAQERSKAAVVEKIAELEKEANRLDYVAPELADKVRAQISAIVSDVKPRTEPATRTDVQRGGAATSAPSAPRARPPQAQPTQAAPQQQMPTGLPAAAQRSPYFAQAESSVNAPIKAPTPQDIIAEQNALSPAAMQESALKQRYEERKARADKEMSAFNASKPSGLDDMIRVLSQSAQYKGGTGLAPAYINNQEAKRAAEAAALKRQNEMYNAADTQEYEGAKDLYGARAGAMKQANQSYQERLKSKSETLAQLANVDQRSIDEALKRLNDMQLQKMRMAQSAAEAGRPGEGERVVAKYLAMRAAGDIKGAEAYMDAIQLVKRGEPKVDPYKQELMKKIAEEEVKLAGMPETSISAGARANLAKMKRDAGITAGGGAEQPTQAHINALKQNPSMAAEFERKFGPGSSARYVK